MIIDFQAHPSFEDMVFYTDATLDKIECTRIEIHLIGCESCRDIIALRTDPRTYLTAFNQKINVTQDISHKKIVLMTIAFVGAYLLLSLTVLALF